jgi:hypothetical protein
MDQQLPPGWTSSAATQLLSVTSDAGGGPGGDLITKGLTTASITNVGLAAAAGTVGTVLVAILGNFKDKPTLAVAAAVIIAGVSFAAAWIVAADLNSRAKVNSARLASVGMVLGKEVDLLLMQSASGSTADTSAGDASKTAAANPGTQSGASDTLQNYAAVPVVGFDVGPKDAPQHLLAVAWTPSTGQTPSNLIYLVADEGEGAPTWRTEIFGVQRVKLSPPNG